MNTGQYIEEVVGMVKVVKEVAIVLENTPTLSILL